MSDDLPVINLLRVRDVSKRLGIKEPTIRTWIVKRRISVVRIGRSVRFRDQDIQTFMRSDFWINQRRKESPLYERHPAGHEDLLDQKIRTTIWQAIKMLENGMIQHRNSLEQINEKLLKMATKDPEVVAKGV